MTLEKKFNLNCKKVCSSETMGFCLPPLSELSSAHGDKPCASTPAVSSRGQDAPPDDVCPPADGAAGMDTFLLWCLAL